MEQRALLLGSLHSHTTDVLRTGFDGVFRHGRSPRPLVKLLSALETASDTTLRRVAVLQLARVNVGRVYDARSRRFAAESAQLPTVQIVTQRLIAGVLLLGFVLVDLGAPKLEALGVLAATHHFAFLATSLIRLAAHGAGAGETRGSPSSIPCEGGMRICASERRVRNGLLHEARVTREISGHDEGAAPVFTLLYLRVKCEYSKLVRRRKCTTVGF